MLGTFFSDIRAKTIAAIGAALLLVVGLGHSAAEPPSSPTDSPTTQPWGISSSAGSVSDHAEWFPKLATAGARTVRMFPEWREIEPVRGTFKWDKPDAVAGDAADSKLRISGVLMGSPPDSKLGHAFPMDDLDGWSNYVGAAVGRYKQIDHWEVWNEGNGGFNDNHNTTTDYARLAAVTYAAAKKANPNAKIGLSVASFDVPYLRQAIIAMDRQKTLDCFDYLCVHPYEIVDGLADPDGEIPYLWMSRLIGDMLKSSAPAKTGAEIWVTEVGRHIGNNAGRQVNERDAAKTLAKVYVMSIAQGIACTQWFEAQDPPNEEQGFGLLKRDGSPRESYQVYRTLTAILGSSPEYLGWMALGADGRGYGFVFAGQRSAVLVAWMPAGMNDKSVSFGRDVSVIDVIGGNATPMRAGEALPLSDTPVLVVGVPDDAVALAKANSGKSFPWGGDYSQAKAVSILPGSADGIHGLFQVGRDATPTVRFPDGSTGILLRGDQRVSFYCHPSFANVLTTDYDVRVTVRRIAPGNVGMNLYYEVADGQGRSPYKNRELWFGASPGNDWQTYTWHLHDASFAKMWGHDITIGPELSVPFVIGKVEVSTESLK